MQAQQHVLTCTSAFLRVLPRKCIQSRQITHRYVKILGETIYPAKVAMASILGLVSSQLCGLKVGDRASSEICCCGCRNSEAPKLLPAARFPKVHHKQWQNLQGLPAHVHASATTTTDTAEVGDHVKVHRRCERSLLHNKAFAWVAIHAAVCRCITLAPWMTALNLTVRGGETRSNLSLEQGRSSKDLIWQSWA